MGHEADMRICNLEDILIQKVYAQDLDTVDAHEMGEVVDMIKDIAEYKRNHYEACYYKSVVEAMDQYGNSRAGYIENMGEMSPEYSQFKKRMDKAADPYYDDRYDRPYNDYKARRRHYTESHSADDKMKMDQHANEHIEVIVETVKDIWNDADPNLRQQMRNRMTELLNQMV